jgi:hypothetical protein
MNINQQEAISIAREFAAKEYECSQFPLLIGEVNARLEHGGFGHKYFGLSESHWSILFNLKSLDPNVAVMDPDHLIVLVDSNSGRAVWFPVM